MSKLMKSYNSLLFIYRNTRCECSFISCGPPVSIVSFCSSSTSEQCEGFSSISISEKSLLCQNETYTTTLLLRDVLGGWNQQRLNLQCSLRLQPPRRPCPPSATSSRACAAGQLTLSLASAGHCTRPPAEAPLDTEVTGPGRTCRWEQTVSLVSTLATACPASWCNSLSIKMCHMF